MFSIHVQICVYSCIQVQWLGLCIHLCSVFMYGHSCMGIHVWEFRLSIQVCVSILTFTFRYSGSVGLNQTHILKPEYPNLSTELGKLGSGGPPNINEYSNLTT